ncbi:uncharacterized protein LOC755565 [Strongylocentrotus purpuratus]|uniref:SAM domain-containing protein n=1 Tax=Strongylocentrotus purpuratus TaxID=7668 RepID=A0A7M7LKY4_STRPU|nr:uncharacterized protein LOC755565 [Strongylocentrotus purpuratus]
MADVAEFLRQKGFNDVDIIKGFMDNDIDMSILPTITESDLRELGIGKTFGERRRLILAIQTPKSTPLSASSSTCSRVQMGQAPLPSRPNIPASYRAPLTMPEDYNIRSILHSHYKGRAVLRELDTGRMPSVMNRRALVQVTVEYLISNGGHLLYPTNEQKHALALAIVYQFPRMRNNLRGEQGYEYLYYKGHGFLEYRLKTLRTTAARRKASAELWDPVHPEGMMGMDLMDSDNQSLGDDIHGQIDDATTSSSPKDNGEPHERVETIALKSSDQWAEDSAFAQMDQTPDPHPTGNDDDCMLVEPEDMLKSHSMKLENQSVRENIRVKLYNVSQSTGQCVNHVECPKMLDIHPGKSQNKSANANIHVQLGQISLQSLNRNYVESQDTLETPSLESPYQSARDSIHRKMGSGYHPSSTGKHIEPPLMMDKHARTSQNRSPNVNSHVEMGHPSHLVSTANNVDSEMLERHFSKFRHQHGSDDIHVLPDQTSHLRQAPSASIDEEASCYNVAPYSRPEHYNIRGILKSHPKGRLVLTDLDLGNMPSAKNRRLLVQVMVAYLVENGGEKLYPSVEQKEALAVAIVSQFPCTKDKLPGAEGHEYLYHKGGGFLEFRLKTLRTTASRHRLKKKSVQPHEMVKIQPLGSPGENISITKVVEEQEEQDDASYDWEPGESENTMAIKAFFKDTHSHRTKWIQDGDMSISDIIAVYPCYKDVPILIDYDFSLKYGAEAANSLISWLPAFTESVLALAKTKERASSILESFGDNGDIYLCALYVLLELLPSPTGKVSKKQQKIAGKTGTRKQDTTNRVFQHHPLGFDVARYVAGKPARLKQPFLLCLGPKTAPEEYYIIADDMAIPAGSSTLEAFGRLFKAYCVFKAHFDSRVLIFYNFFSSVVYKVTNNISPQVRAFYLLLSNQEN